MYSSKTGRLSTLTDDSDRGTNSSLDGLDDKAMSDLSMILAIKNDVTIPVMGKAGIRHFIESQTDICASAHITHCSA